MTKARILAQVVSAGNVLADGQIGLAELGLENVNNTPDNSKQVLSAATWTTARTLNYSGDVSGSSSVDGSQDVTTILTLATSGVTAGTYGSATNIPQVTIDTKGRVTAVTDVAVSIPSGSLTFTGDVTGSGNTGSSTALILADSGVTAGTYTKVTTDAKGRVTSGTTLSASDIPNLDAAKITTGVLDAARLPSYVDDVLEYSNLAGFPVSGETGKIYVALDTNKTYRWSGSTYIYITSGAVDSVAGKTGIVTLVKGDVGLGSVENKSSATIRSEITSSNVTTALGFTPYNATNPSGYITSSALSSYLPLSGGTLTGSTLFYRNNPAISNGSYSTGQNHIELRTDNGSNPAIGFHRSGYSAVTLYHDSNNSLRLRDANTGTDSLLIHSSNYSGYSNFGGNSVYGGIYYDGNDTGYYCDPNSTSNMYKVTAYQGAKYTTSDWADGFRNTPVSSRCFHGDISSGGPQGTWWFYDSMRHSNTSSYWGTQIAYGWEDNANEIWQRNITGNSFSGWVRYINTNNYTGILDGRYHRDDVWFNSKYFSSGGAIYGVIFYDANNSGYYADLNNTTYCYYLQSATTVRADSDRRLKDNIETIENALSKVLKLRGTSFTRKDLEDKTKVHIGFIAQEVLEVVPEVVGGSEQSTYSVGYGELTALLVEAIKEQQKQIEQLKSQNNTTPTF